MMLYHVNQDENAKFAVPHGHESNSRGFERASLIDRTHGSVHMGVGICRLAPQGETASFLHANEKGIYVIEGEIDLRIGDAAVKLAAAGRSSGVTTDITNAPRAGTSICDSAPLNNKKPNATGKLGAKAAAMTQRFAGIWVNTMQLIKPMRLATAGAINCEVAVAYPAQKKNAPAVESDMPKRSNSHNAISEFTIMPVPNESTEKSAASFHTVAFDGPRGAAGFCSSARTLGNPRYSTQTATPMRAYKTNIKRKASSMLTP